MKNVKLRFLLILFLIFGLSYQGNADCPRFVKSNTELEAAGSKIGKGIANFFKFKWSDLDFDEKLLQYIRAAPVNNQETNSYFDPKIKVCDYEWGNCHELSSGTSCHHVYGTQSSGAGVSAAVFIDWEGDKTKAGGKFAEGLEWEWAEYVSDEQKIRFANSPKICACSQKGACMSGISSWNTRVFSGENIFRPGEMENVCDTCYQTKVQCVPVPLAPGPPPFCEQLAMSPPQVRIVPVRNQDNDYFHPRVGIIVGELKERREIYVPSAVSNHENILNWTYPIPDKDTIHYFKTYRKKGQLCAEYYGTEREESKRKLQFPARCFPAPPAPEPEEIKVVNENTLEVKMKMDKRVCTKRAGGIDNNGVCTFNVSSDAKDPIEVGPLFLTVVKPAIVEKTTGNKDGVNNIIEGILKNNSQFKVLENYGYVPDIETECKEFKDNKCKLDDSGYPKIEVKYKENPKSKMLCLSGWQPEPEEFVLKKGSDLVSLKSMRVGYAKYNTVYSKESNQSYYFPCKKGENIELVDVLAKPQDEINEIIFNKKGYVSIPEENKNRDNCVANKDNEIDTKQNCNKCKIVYELTDGKHKEKCEQGDDGCLCFDGVCSRSTQYVRKNDKDNKPFYLRYKEVDCKDKNGDTLKNEKDEIQKCTQLEDQPIKANRTEVFYADKLCRFDLESVKEKVLDTIKKKTKSQNFLQPYEFSGDNNYTSNLSKYGYIEIEAWGGGEAGHIDGKAHSSESRPGMPGDYIKVQLKIDPEYPIIRAKATEGGGGLTSHISNKDGGPTWIEMCNSRGQNCKPLITVTGGGVHKEYGGQKYNKTKIHDALGSLKVLGNPTVVKGKELTGDNQIAYIENGQIKPGAVQCSSASSNKHGAGGCINTNSKIYGRGSPGYVMIRSVKIDYEEVKEIIDTLVKNPDSNSVSNLIKELYPDIIKEIKEEIIKELLGKGS